MTRYYITVPIPGDVCRSIVTRRDKLLQEHGYDLQELYDGKHIATSLHWTIKAPFKATPRHYRSFMEMVQERLALVQDGHVAIRGMNLMFGDWSGDAMIPGSRKEVPIHTMSLAICGREKGAAYNLRSFQYSIVMECLFDFHDLYQPLEQDNRPHVSLMTNMSKYSIARLRPMHRDLRHLFEKDEHRFLVSHVQVMKKDKDAWILHELIPVPSPLA